jgi:Lysozyme like domain
MANYTDANGVVAAAEAAGFTGAALVMAIAVSFAEDGSHQVDAVNHNNNGSVDRGLWQINSVHSEFDANSLLSDPTYNAKAAYQVSNGGKNWGAWVTFNNGAAEAQISAAEGALANGPGHTTVGRQFIDHVPGVGTVDSVGHFLGDLANPSLWKRIGIGAVGAVLLLLAAILVFRRPLEGAAKVGAKAAVFA